MRRVYLFCTAVLVCAACQNTQQGSTTSAPNISSMDSPAGAESSLPYLIQGADSVLYLSWVKKSNESTVFMYSRLVDEQWTEPQKIASGTDWFVNWADYPMISVSAKKEMIAHYLAKSSKGTYSYDVNIVRKSTGKEWSMPLIPHNDGTPTEHGFVTMIPLSDNNFQVAWLDGRKTVGDHNESGGAMTLRTAQLNMHGDITNEFELDYRVCDCCQTSGVLTSNGPIIVYRDRSELEIRDISIVRMVDGRWTQPQPIHSDQWEIKGCPVNGPRADAIGNVLGIVWYSSANNNPQVKAIFSTDGGANFYDPIVIDNTNPMGRVDITMIDEKRAVVSWLDESENKSVIKSRIVYTRGDQDNPVVLTSTSDERSSGFPQIAYYQNNLYLSWTDQSNQYSQVKVIKFNL